MSYLAHVAVRMPRSVHSTSDPQRVCLDWRGGKNQAVTLCLRTVFIFLPQPEAACLRLSPAPGALSLPAASCLCTFTHAD